jgi:hypothetical protein
MASVSTEAGSTKAAKKPLKIGCTTTDCKNGLHYFGPNGRKKAKSPHPPGKCIECGAGYIDWALAASRAPANENYKMQMLRQEWVRHHFWEHYRPTQREINYARRKGMTGLALRTERVLTKSVFGVTGFLNDIQTPYSGVVSVAQHATATCCRKCIEYWHGIPRGGKATRQQIQYLRDWIMKFIAAKYPTLSDLGEKVPSLRKKT